MTKNYIVFFKYFAEKGEGNGCFDDIEVTRRKNTKLDIHFIAETIEDSLTKERKVKGLKKVIITGIVDSRKI